MRYEIENDSNLFQFIRSCFEYANYDYHNYFDNIPDEEYERIMEIIYNNQNLLSKINIKKN